MKRIHISTFSTLVALPPDHISVQRAVPWSPGSSAVITTTFKSRIC